MDQLTESTLEQASYTREDFGLLMKELREKAGFSIDEVSVSTRISYSYVEALENGDFEKLPGVVFVKGFVKNLIKTYGVKDMDVIAKLDLVYRQKEKEHFDSPIANENKQFFMAKKKEYKGHSVGVRFQNLVLNNRKKIMYSLATAMVVTVSLSFFIRKFYVEENTGSKQVVETTKKEPSKKLLAVKPDSKKMSAKTITSVTKVSDDLVKLIVLKNTKLKISSDNKKWINLTLKPDTYEYKFDSNVRFVFTDASAVEINYNGREMKKLGAKGEMKRVAVRKKKWLGETKKSL